MTTLTCVRVDAASQVKVEAGGGVGGVDAKLVKVMHTFTAWHGRNRQLVGVTLPLVHHVSASNTAHTT